MSLSAYDEEYFITNDEKERSSTNIYTLIIYDIIDNRKRVRLAKHLQGYGFRIQKSCFEAMITEDKYKKLLKELPRFASEEDSIRVYKIIGKGQVTSFGRKEEDLVPEDIILV